MLLLTHAAGQLGTNERFLVANGTDFQAGGINVNAGTAIVQPWLISATDNAYLTYGAGGFASAPFTVTQAAGAAGTYAAGDLVTVNGAITNTITQPGFLALRTGFALSPVSTSGVSGTAAFQGVNNANPWTITSGGVIFNGAITVTPGLIFGAAPAVVHTNITAGTFVDLGTVQITSTPHPPTTPAPSRRRRPGCSTP